MKIFETLSRHAFPCIRGGRGRISVRKGMHIFHSTIESFGMYSDGRFRLYLDCIWTSRGYGTVTDVVDSSVFWQVKSR